MSNAPTTGLSRGDRGTAPVPSRWRSGLKYAAATLATVTIAATLSVYFAAWASGIQLNRFPGFADGGAIGVLAASGMWAWCRGWGSWALWVWLPVAVVVATTFFVISTGVAGARADPAPATRPDPAQACDVLQADVEIVEEQVRSLARASHLAADHATWTADVPPRRPDRAAVAEITGQADAYDYWVAEGGPHLEQRAEQLRYRYDATC